MRGLIENEIRTIGGATNESKMSTLIHDGDNIIITVSMGDCLNLNGYDFTWAGVYKKKTLIEQDGEVNGYKVNYSMGSDVMAHYILTPVTA